MSKYPPALQQLMTTLKQLPGVGAKTAERFAFQLLTWSDESLLQFSSTIAKIKEDVPLCPVCHCLSSPTGCHFCNLAKRDATLLCIVGSPKDVYAIEETHSYSGLYHVLGSLISPLDGRTLQHLNLTTLFHRLSEHPIREVIIALDSTLEGDATALYLKEKIHALNIHVSRLAFGLPMGSPLEYVDGGTLSRAFIGRQLF
ncbi:recombination mediator RecR [Rhabdochlamydiaceae symbiont of Dictyostelium giganteum]|uniref:recombination mediator RecR n=1 Tax=Rhabdochlamydiaceae symbiont of Dictyostelium giganteum TaxID=3342349 RepID=UPI00384C3EA9